MKLPKAPWQTKSGMPRLLRVLGSEAGETRFVGGCVRDTLLGLEASDGREPPACRESPPPWDS